MRFSRFVGMLALATVAAGVIKHLPEIRRYVRMYTL
jgi:hypothetical protein